MELKDRKFINNTGKLPGFDDGRLNMSSDDYQKNLGQWMQNLQSAKNPPAPVSTADVPKPGLFQFSGAQNSVQNMLKQTPNIPKQDVSTPDAKKIGKFADSQRISAGVSGGLSLFDAGYKAFNDYQPLDEQLAEMRTINRKVMGIDTPILQEAKNGKLPGFSNGLSNMLGGIGGGAMLGGSIVPGWGHVIGGLLGAGITGIGELVSEGRQNEIKKNRNNIVTSINNASHDSSVGIAQRILNLQTYGDQYSQPLHAANGKLPGFVGGKPTYTVFGATNKKPNSKLSGGEIAYNKQEGVASEVGGPEVNNDSQYGFLRASDGVLSNKPGFLGYSPADLFRATGDIDASENYMIASNFAKGKTMHAACGKLPKHAEGWLGNAIPAFLGGIAGLGQTISTYNNRPYRPNTYAGNPYEGSALTTLASLRINPYPIMSQLRNAEARTNRAIDIAGGLSGGQRTAARLAALNTTQGNISKLLSDIQQQNNAYRANYALAAINAGQTSRQARMSANQWDLDYYSKAHAARNRGIQTGIANMLAQIQQYQANEFKRRQFNETMDLYRDDMDQRKKNFEWMANQSTRGIGADPATNNLTSPLQGYTPSTNLLFNLQQWDRDMKKKYPFLTYNPYRRF